VGEAVNVAEGVSVGSGVTVSSGGRGVDVCGRDVKVSVETIAGGGIGAVEVIALHANNRIQIPAIPNNIFFIFDY
jgi:hypothetical protein